MKIFSLLTVVSISITYAVAQDVNQMVEKAKTVVKPEIVDKLFDCFTKCKCMESFPKLAQMDCKNIENGPECIGCASKCGLTSLGLMNGNAITGSKGTCKKMCEQNVQKSYQGYCGFLSMFDKCFKAKPAGGKADTAAAIGWAKCMCTEGKKMQNVMG